MNMLDGVMLAYAAWSGARGAKRGLPDEAYRLLRLVVSLGAGCGLFAIVNKIVASVMALGGDTTGGGLGFAGGLALAFIAMRKLRAGVTAAVQHWADQKIIRPGGALLGALRGAIAIITLVAFVQVTPWIPSRNGMAHHSIVGRLVSQFVPHREASAEAPVEAPSEAP
jgi:uncharacterized membrane protein required for colicin V production